MMTTHQTLWNSRTIPWQCDYNGSNHCVYMLLYSYMDANIQLVPGNEQFWDTFPRQHFPLMCFKFPDISRSSRQVVSLSTTDRHCTWGRWTTARLQLGSTTTSNGHCISINLIMLQKISMLRIEPLFYYISISCLNYHQCWLIYKYWL